MPTPFSKNPEMNRIFTEMAGKVFGEGWEKKVKRSKRDGNLCLGEWQLSIKENIIRVHKKGKLHDPDPNTPSWSSYFPSGEPEEFSFHENGFYRDSLGSRPGQVTFHKNGQVSMVRFFQAVEQHDLADGRAAHTEYYPDGAVLRVTHCLGHGEQDLPDGTPASVAYYPDGTVESIMHCQSGKFHDPPGGGACLVSFARDGSVTSEKHYWHNEEKTAEESAILHAREGKRRLKRVLANADPGVQAVGMMAPCPHVVMAGAGRELV